VSEHFTRNTESIRCWCYTCNDLTDHAVSDGQIGRCNNDHSKKKDPKKAAIPSFEYDIGNADTAGKKRAVSDTDWRHIAALDGAGNRGEH
jgi:hypothetical protein